MITNEQLDATYHQMIVALDIFETIDDFEWGYKQFNKRMIELYPELNPVQTFDISSRQLSNIKKTRRTK